MRILFIILHIAWYYLIVINADVGEYKSKRRALYEGVKVLLGVLFGEEKGE